MKETAVSFFKSLALFESIQVLICLTTDRSWESLFSWEAQLAIFLVTAAFTACAKWKEKSKRKPKETIKEKI